MSPIDPFAARTRIAYFSMEIALRAEIHTYSGGLGVLAGDTARSCADLKLPVVFVTLVSRQGYLRQEIDDAGRQVEHADPWDPVDWATPLGARITVALDGRDVWVHGWLHVIRDRRGHEVPVLLLDTDVKDNDPEDRRITDRLYGGDDAHRLKQEAVLGIGGVRLLHALGFAIETWHLNEGHAALLAAELLRRHPLPYALKEAGGVYDVAQVKAHCIFTTHTPVASGHDRFGYELVARVLDGFIDLDQLKLHAGAEDCNMTRLALSLSGYVNGVAERHAETAHRLYPGHRIHAITNGIHVGTWAAPSIARLFDRHFPHWVHEPEILVRADVLDDEEVWQAHVDAKQALVDAARAATGIALAADRPIFGFARRMTGYKRPDLLFSDLERLRAIARERPFQVVLAGKAHPHDGQGKWLIEQLHGYVRQLEGAIPVAFLPNYDLRVAKLMVGGCDVWLNTPLPPLEASGTSGMKAALNGVLNLSVLDGWWVEACIDGRTGWSVGSDGAASAHEHAAALYDRLAQTILPLYDDDRRYWLFMMKQAISKIASYFNSQRMMRRYATEAYLR
ncbi:MAG: alpha-glucan family phosphorylase [Rhodospirillaceae bacterium]